MCFNGKNHIQVFFIISAACSHTFYSLLHSTRLYIILKNQLLIELLLDQDMGAKLFKGSKQ